MYVCENCGQRVGGEPGRVGVVSAAERPAIAVYAAQLRQAIRAGRANLAGMRGAAHRSQCGYVGGLEHALWLLERFPDAAEPPPPDATEPLPSELAAAIRAEREALS